MCLGNVIKYLEKESDKDFSPYIVFFVFFLRRRLTFGPHSSRE